MDSRCLGRCPVNGLKVDGQVVEQGKERTHKASKLSVSDFLQIGISLQESKQTNCSHGPVLQYPESKLCFLALPQFIQYEDKNQHREENQYGDHRSRVLGRLGKNTRYQESNTVSMPES